MVRLMNGRQLFLEAVHGRHTESPSVGTATSVANVEAMELCGASFPEAHLDAEQMAELAAFVSETIQFDTINPVYSVVQEAAALGADIDWGKKDEMPFVSSLPWREPTDICVPVDFERHPAMATVLESLRILKGRYGRDYAIVGKAFGPWSLSYHMFGVENILMMTIEDPIKLADILAKLSEVTMRSAFAQIDAGADVLCLADHCSRDMCSAETYLHFLQPLHRIIAKKVACPIVLHTCGDTSDRIQYFADTGISCFHYDTRVAAEKAVELVSGRMSLMGGVNNVESLLAGDEIRVASDVRSAMDAGIHIIGPECAIPLRTSMHTLASIRKAVEQAAV